MDRVLPTHIGKSASTLHASSRARSPPIYQYCSPLSLILSLTSRLPKQLALRFHRRSSPAPTRSLNEKAHFHCSTRQRGGVATGGAGAASDAGDWISRPH